MLPHQYFEVSVDVLESIVLGFFKGAYQVLLHVQLVFEVWLFRSDTWIYLLNRGGRVRSLQWRSPWKLVNYEAICRNLLFWFNIPLNGGLPQIVYLTKECLLKSKQVLVRDMAVVFEDEWLLWVPPDFLFNRSYSIESFEVIWNSL